MEGTARMLMDWIRHAVDVDTATALAITALVGTFMFAFFFMYKYETAVLATPMTVKHPSAAIAT